MLSIGNLTVSIQGSLILRGISLEVGAGELVCLVGRNGAGKTTTFRMIMGLQRAVSGSIEFLDRPLIGLSAHQIAQLGVGYSPEESQVFADLSVAENIEMPTWTRRSARPAGERVAQAYAIFPKLLLLDEPFEGLSPAIIPSISEGIASIRALGHGVLMAESNVHHIPEYADRLYVLERGEIIYQGKPGDSYPPEVTKVITGGA